MAAPNDKQIIFSMVRVSKTHNPGKQVLKDISLSFYYGAKIGVLGLNGSGKSSLLRIIAGIDTNHSGEVLPSRNYSIGFLEQEPKLDENKTVLDSVKEGVSEVVALLTEYDAISAKFADPDLSPDDMDKLVEKRSLLAQIWTTQLDNYHSEQFLWCLKFLDDARMKIDPMFLN